MLPLNLSELAPDLTWILSPLLFFLIGAGFGIVLELAGFGDSRKLAAQFYFKDMTVLKTMFTGILVACLLIFLSSSLGQLDFSKIFVNPTYLWPGIVGGLVMGVGFIVGGYCPGTSVVSAASLKLDGIVFFIGTIIGAGLFGESVWYFEEFWNSSYLDRYLLSDWLGWSIGAVVVAVTVMALLAFWGAEKAEVALGREPLKKHVKVRYQLAAGAALAIALTVLFVGQPSADQKWSRLGRQYENLLTSKEAFIHPLEWVKTWNDSSIKLITLDLRKNDDFKAFHLDSSENMDLSETEDPQKVSRLIRLPPQGVVILVAADDDTATTAWKRLKVQGVTNVYILEGGLRDWVNLFSQKSPAHEPIDLTRPPAEILESFPKDFFKPKIKLKTAKRGGGLCS